MQGEEVVITSRHELELRLSGHDAPDGEINLADLGPIAAALQELATRIGRHLVDQTGTGRSFAAVENAALLRLRGLGKGSVTLSVALGQAEVLDIDDGLEQETADRFWEVVIGMAEDRKPDWTPPTVAESAVTLLNALQHAATSVMLSVDRGDAVSFNPAKADLDVWRPIEAAAQEPRRMIGRLKMVDIEQGRFRLRDDVGNAILLHHVVDPDRVAGLVGQRVAATGPAVYDASGKFLRLDGPTIEANPIPQEWTIPPKTDIEALIAAARRYDPDDAVELTDQEWAAWLDATRR